MILVIFLCVLLGFPTSAIALEKYGRTTPSFDAPEEERISGYALMSMFLLNTSFTARPDNTGLVGSRYMLHLERDVLNHRLTLYTDHNVFTDKTMGWMHTSEWDGTIGMMGPLGHDFRWRLQYERDSSLDRHTITQSYANVLITKMWDTELIDAYIGAGGLFYNESYFARPNNTGRALFNYVAHLDLHFFDDHLIPYADAMMFTDRTAQNVMMPSELDWIIGVAFRQENREVAVFFEQDRSIDRVGLTQQYLAIQVRYAF